MNKRDNLMSTFQVMYRWRKAIRNVCLLVLVVSIVLCLTMKDYYRATTIFYPTSPQLANPELMFGNTGQVTEYYGGDRELDRLSEIANGQELVDFMVTRFDLYQSYGQDSTSRKGRQKVREIFRGLYSAQKNKNDAIELSVEDTDPQRAADMANAAREKVNEIAQELMKQSQGRILAAFDDNLKRKQADLAQLSDSLRTVQTKFGIYDPQTQAELLSTQLSTAESEITKDRARLEVLQGNKLIRADTVEYIKANLRAYERQRDQLTASKSTGGNLSLNRFNEGFPLVSILQDLHFQARKQLSYDLERYNQIRATYNTKIPALLTVTNAEVPLVKSRPKRSIIVISAVLAAFLFTVLAALLAEAYREVDWKEVKGQ